MAKKLARKAAVKVSPLSRAKAAQEAKEELLRQIAEQEAIIRKAKPQILKSLVKKVIKEAAEAGVDPIELANEVCYTVDPSLKPKAWLYSSDGAERYSQGPKPEWLKKMQKKRGYSLLQHFEQSRTHATLESVELYDAKISELRKKSKA